MNEIKKNAVIIPFYKEKLTESEHTALKQCFKILCDHTIIAIKPQTLTLSAEITVYPFFDDVSFADEYFKDIQGYNRLMLDAQFYGRFLKYEYILIYQLDAFLFKDELQYWCGLGIDYVGAPWIREKEYPNNLKAIVSKGLQHLARRYDIKKHGLPSKKQFDNTVGNGGFSLRRVEAFYNICISDRKRIDEYNRLSTHHYNEDAFWSIEVNRKKKVLNIPDYKTALRFAFELAPERSLRINNNELPFGCHAWDKHTVFWRPFFKEQGYEI